MTISFTKYQGTGNDFILIDNRARLFPAENQALIAHLCHRRFGIGADGLILLEPDESADFRMVYFNADGRASSMCGNGGRCIVRFAHDLGLFESETRFQAVDGEHLAVVCEDEIFLKMSDVVTPIDRAGLTFADTGSPHVVCFKTDHNDGPLQTIDIVAEGRAIRYSEAFGPGGTNVNFVQVLDDNLLFVRTYERGVEDETYSCGTGVTAAALVAHRQHGLPDPVFVQTPGGSLRVSFNALPDGSFDNIYLIGPARRVFSGEVTV
jgi:diaminopimelate epimerase